MVTAAADGLLPEQRPVGLCPGDRAGGHADDGDAPKPARVDGKPVPGARFRGSGVVPVHGVIGLGATGPDAQMRHEPRLVDVHARSMSAGISVQATARAGGRSEHAETCGDKPRRAA
jgi:hypothetical protein